MDRDKIVFEISDSLSVRFDEVLWTTRQPLPPGVTLRRDGTLDMGGYTGPPFKVQIIGKLPCGSA